MPPLFPSLLVKRLPGSPNTLRGMGNMLAFAFFMSSMIACVRHLSGQLHPFELAFFRTFFGFVFFIPVFFRHGAEPLRSGVVRIHMLRSALHVTSVILFFYGLSLTPLAKAIAISFSAPLFATLLALLMLGEVVRGRRISALVVGFIGTIVVLRPGIVEIDIGSITILAAAIAWGSAIIVIKVLSRTEASLTTTIYATIFMTPVTLLVALPVWQMPDLTQLVWLGLIGGLGSIGHLCMAQAVKEADVSAVLPMEFTKLIWGALYGFVLFTEIPDWGTWVGGIMIFASVSYIAVRERQVRSPTIAPVSNS